MVCESTFFKTMVGHGNHSQWNLFQLPSHSGGRDESPEAKCSSEGGGWGGKKRLSLRRCFLTSLVVAGLCWFHVYES